MVLMQQLSWTNLVISRSIMQQVPHHSFFFEKCKISWWRKVKRHGLWQAIMKLLLEAKTPMEILQLHCNICVLICQLASLGKWTEGITSCDPGYSVVTVDKNNIVTLINKAENSSKICRMKIEYGVFDNGCDPANFDDGEWCSFSYKSYAPVSEGRCGGLVSRVLITLHQSWCHSTMAINVTMRASFWLNVPSAHPANIWVMWFPRILLWWKKVDELRLETLLAWAWMES